MSLWILVPWTCPTSRHPNCSGYAAFPYTINYWGSLYARIWDQITITISQISLSPAGLPHHLKVDLVRCPTSSSNWDPELSGGGLNGTYRFYQAKMHWESEHTKSSINNQFT